MNWTDRILNSDAGRIARARAEDIIKEVEDSLPGCANGPSVCDSPEQSSASQEGEK